MTDPATFVINASKDRIEVMLGSNLVGFIEQERRDTSAVLYRLLLPIDGAPGRYNRAPSTQQARAMILCRMVEWLNNASGEAGLFDGVASLVEAQARREKEAAEAPGLFVR